MSVTKCKFILFELDCALLSKVDAQMLFFSPQIANPQILGLNPQSKIRKFLRYASPQFSNPQISFD